MHATPEPPAEVSTEIGQRRQLDERGEGVISTAIAVLIIAFLGIVCGPASTP